MHCSVHDTKERFPFYSKYFALKCVYLRGLMTTLNGKVRIFQRKNVRLCASFKKTLRIF